MELSARVRLQAALPRYPAQDIAVNAAVGAAIGAGNVVPTRLGWPATSEDRALAAGTGALCAMMVQTGTLLVANARLFSKLGRTAVRAEVLSLHCLRPFSHAPLRPMLLIMGLLAGYPLMLLGAGRLGRRLVYLALPLATRGGKGAAEALLARLF